MADHQRVLTISSGGLFLLWALLEGVWICLNSTLAIDSVVTGALIAGGLAYTFTRKPSVWQDVVMSPVRFYHFILYTGIFLIEMARANINMLRYVYARRIEVNPVIVKINTNLKTPVGRLALANSIALTPGSLVVDIDGDSLFIHCLDAQTIDPDELTRLIAGPFEKQLEKAFG